MLLASAPLLYFNLLFCLAFFPYVTFDTTKILGDFLFITNFTGLGINGVTWSLSHEMQFGVALLPGTGYRVIVPYQDNVSCDVNDLNKRVCTGRVPFFLDAQISVLKRFRVTRQFLWRCVHGHESSGDHLLLLGASRQ